MCLENRIAHGIIPEETAQHTTEDSDVDVKTAKQ